MPVDEGKLVFVRYRCGEEAQGLAGAPNSECEVWTHTANAYDIVAYRLA